MEGFFRAALKLITGIFIVPLAAALSFLWGKLEESGEEPWWKKLPLWVLAALLYIIVAPLYPRWEDL